MKNINMVCVSGNLTKDAKFKKVCNFSIAVNENRKNENGEWEEYPNFIDCVIFGKYGKTMAEYLTKGTKVAIQGKLSQSRWTDDDDNLQSRIQVIVDNIELLTTRNSR